MLTLTEELLILSLYEKRDTVGLPYSAALPYALAGALLVELILAGKVKLDKEKRVVLVDDLQLVTEKRLDELLTMIRESDKPRKVTHWITTTAGNSKKLPKDMLVELIDRGVLRKDEKKVLWGFPSSESSQQVASAKYLRKQQLRDIVLGGKTPDQRSVALLSLLKAIDLLYHIFTFDEIKSASVLVNRILKDEAIGKTMIENLDAISSASAASALAAIR